MLKESPAIAPGEEPLRATDAESAPPFLSPETVLADYRLAFRSRQASLLGRREVLTGKAKFGIFGDGKEVAQVALAHAFRPGDWRSGYYRDQTLMMALGLLTIEQFFAQLYADPDPEREPCSAGRSMTAHFSTCLVRPDGAWVDQTARVNSAADVSPTGSQMPRLVGLAYASRLYRELPDLAAASPTFTRHGDEVAFGTIGNASCAEGLFWESVNAAGVVRGPLLLSIWDDGYGISVPNELQIAKGDLSEVLAGFRRAPGSRDGYDLYRVRGWDYPALCDTFWNAAEIVRREHVPAIVHVVEMTQPQGHSTSGSHERYKSRERLAWEAKVDCIQRMRQWLLDAGVAGDEELRRLEEEDRRLVRDLQRKAWDEFRAPIEEERRALVALTEELARVGHLALAVARSWSNALTASAGIVSVIGGPLPTGRGRAIDEVIRTTAPMHEGFAGGAFVDTSGHVLGIATAAAIRGLGVVIPAAIAWKTAAALQEHGRVKRGYLGLAGQPVRLAERQRGDDGREQALLVVGVTPGSPADAVGILVGDVMLAFDGHPVESPEDLLELLTGDRVGRSVPLRVLRGGEARELTVTVGERPAG